MTRWRLGLFFLLGFLTAARAQQAPPPDIAVAALYRACVAGDLDQVKTLVEAGTPVNGQTGLHGYTPLIAAAAGHFDILSYLISKHADLNNPDYDGNTPLYWACYDDNTDIALALIDAGANVNAPSNVGHTPLMCAAMRGNDQIVTALLAHKANYDANGRDGPAVTWAVIGDKLSTLKLLVAAGARLDLSPDGGDPGAYSLLGRAALYNDVDLVNFLIDQKLDVDSSGSTGVTPLMGAALFNCTKALERLLDLGANINAQDDDGSTALMLARNADLTQTLLQHHPSLELKNKKGMTALMFAAGMDDILRVQKLVAAGADINATDVRGETALTLAGDVGGVDVVQLLKDKGAKRTDVHIIAKAAPAEPLSPAHAWALAVGAVLIQREGFNPRLLGGGDTSGAYRRTLKTWNIYDKASLVAALNGLRDRAHLAIENQPVKFSSIVDENLTLMHSSPVSSNLAAVGNRDPLTMHPTATMFQTKPASTAYLNGTGRNGLASEICRSVNLINAGFASHYLDESESWDRLMDLARLAQTNFNSWKELSDNFLNDSQLRITDFPHYDACVKLLLNPKDPNSPWNQNPWKTDLSAPDAAN